MIAFDADLSGTNNDAQQENEPPLRFDKKDIGLYVPCYQVDDPFAPRRSNSSCDNSNHDNCSIDSGCHDSSPTSSYQRKSKLDGKDSKNYIEVKEFHVFNLDDCSSPSSQGSNKGRPSSSVLAEEIETIENAFEGIEQGHLAFI